MTPFLELMLVLGVIVLGAKLAGWVLGRLGQPTVVGEIAFGLLLGPTVFDLLGQPLFTHAAATGETVHMLAELGVVLLMFLAGLETDVAGMRHVGMPALSAAVGGVLLPFFGGWGIGVLAGLPVNESVFIGTILTATSVSISAQTLLELKKLRTKEGMTILGAAVIDDVLGILMLSVVVAVFATGGPAPALWLVAVKMVGYFLVAVLLAPVLRAFLTRFSKLHLNQPVTAAALVVVLVYSWSAEFLGGLAAITGAYIAGILLARSEFKAKLQDATEVFTYGFFVSIFFVDIGMRANLREALGGPLLWLGLAIIAIAVLSKIIGSGAGARLMGFSHHEALRVGTGMVSRGEVGLIVAAIGVQRQVVSQEVFALMVLMVVVTTLVTPVLLRASFRVGPPSEEPTV